MPDGRLVFAFGVLGLVGFAALAAPLLAPHDPLAQDLLASLLPPLGLAGADPLYPLGTALGLLAGWLGGWVADLVSRLDELWMAFPPVLLSIVLVAVTGARLHAVILAIVIVDWTRFCRVVRAEVQAQKARAHVVAARMLGLGGWRTLWSEVRPNLAPLFLVLLTLEMRIAVIVEAILSFVGLSVASDAPTWGGVIAEGRAVVYQAPWLMALPMLCIVALVLAFNLLGDGLSDRLDPVLRR